MNEIKEGEVVLNITNGTKSSYIIPDYDSNKYIYKIWAGNPDQGLAYLETYENMPYGNKISSVARIISAKSTVTFMISNGEVFGKRVNVDFTFSLITEVNMNFSTIYVKRYSK